MVVGVWLKFTNLLVFYTILEYTINMNYTVRVNKMVGQLEALARMANEKNVSCGEVLQQVNAIQGAVASLKRQIIDDSLGECLDSRNAHKEVKKLLTNIRRYV